MTEVIWITFADETDDLRIDDVDHYRMTRDALTIAHTDGCHEQYPIHRIRKIHCEMSQTICVRTEGNEASAESGLVQRNE